jgi:tetratricopeptide (TPR) repeat protein
LNFLWGEGEIWSSCPELVEGWDLRKVIEMKVRKIFSLFQLPVFCSLLLCPALIFVGLRGTAMAEAGQNVRVALLDLSDKEQVFEQHRSLVFQRLIQELAEVEGWVIMPPAEAEALLSGRVVSAEKRKQLKASEDLLVEGKNLFSYVEFDESLASLKKAQEVFESNFAVLEDIGPLSETYFYLGANYMAKGLVEEALEEFRKVVRLDPERELVKGSFFQDAIDGFEKAKEEVLSSPQATLTVRSSPSLSEVYLDSRKVGVTPLTVKVVPPGRHQLRLEKEGYQADFREIDAAPGVARDFEITLREAGGAVVIKNLVEEIEERGGRGNVLAQYASKLGRILDCRYLTIGRMTPLVEKYQLAVFLFDVWGNKMVKRKGETLDIGALDFEDKIHQLTSALVEEVRIGKEVSIRKEEELSQLPMELERTPEFDSDLGKRRRNQIWLWSSVGSAVVCGVMAGVFYAGAADAEETNNAEYELYMNSTDPEEIELHYQRAKDAADESKSKALYGNIALGVGVAAAGSAIWAALTYPKETVELSRNTGIVPYYNRDGEWGFALSMKF